MTDPYREARDAEGERSGIIYPLLPRAARPDTWLQIDAALPEAAPLDRRTRPTVLDIVESRLPENHQPQGQRLARRQSRKRIAAIALRGSTDHPSARLHGATGVNRSQQCYKQEIRLT